MPIFKIKCTYLILNILVVLLFVYRTILLEYNITYNYISFLNGYMI